MINVAEYAKTHGRGGKGRRVYDVSVSVLAGHKKKETFVVYLSKTIMEQAGLMYGDRVTLLVEGDAGRIHRVGNFEPGWKICTNGRSKKSCRFTLPNFGCLPEVECLTPAKARVVDGAIRFVLDRG